MLAGLGLGGGVILIPATVFFLKISPQEAKYLSLVAYIPSAVAMIVSGIQNKNIEFDKIKNLIPIAVSGAIAGGFVSRFIKNDFFNLIYSVFLILFGIYMLIKSIKNMRKHRDFT